MDQTANMMANSENNITGGDFPVVWKIFVYSVFLINLMFFLFTFLCFCAFWFYQFCQPMQSYPQQ